MMIIASIPLSAEQVRTDYDRSANFERYRTYSWKQVRTADPLWADRIRSAVNRELAAKGWTEVPSGGDAAVVAIETTKDHRTLDTFYNGFGGWRWGGFGNAITNVEVYKVGTLVLDIFDANTRGLIWRGVSTDTLSNKSDKNIKKLNKDVQKLLHNFPPSNPRT
jgi:hypothetical protein